MPGLLGPTRDLLSDSVENGCTAYRLLNPCMPADAATQLGNEVTTSEHLDVLGSEDLPRVNPGRLGGYNSRATREDGSVAIIFEMQSDTMRLVPALGILRKSSASIRLGGR